MDVTNGSGKYATDGDQKCQMGSNTLVSKGNQVPIQWWKKHAQQSNGSVAYTKSEVISEVSSATETCDEGMSSLFCRICVKPHLSEQSLAACTFCDHLSCRSGGCIRQCEMCERPYCVFCSRTNYDETNERIFCLECDNQVKNEMNVG
eukprot:CAMPEP_0116007746 /NCGR_PEP_ID=MMETSP0321-20121206/2471_1 /TAXON_ID=163516 /ORGANISM="Leptocylindrus danicus var. danicus, Strain B650" /LENGTH=147 /DNA_ID=CAMNT_0003476477 /DNA_START=331 /DNA_END=774 /DNA_ORIENTATION=+